MKLSIVLVFVALSFGAADYWEMARDTGHILAERFVINSQNVLLDLVLGKDSLALVQKDPRNIRDCPLCDYPVTNMLSTCPAVGVGSVYEVSLVLIAFHVPFTRRLISRFSLPPRVKFGIECMNDCSVVTTVDKATSGKWSNHCRLTTHVVECAKQQSWWLLLVGFWGICIFWALVVAVCIHQCCCSGGSYFDQQ